MKLKANSYLSHSITGSIIDVLYTIIANRVAQEIPTRTIKLANELIDSYLINHPGYEEIKKFSKLRVYHHNVAYYALNKI